MHQSTKTVIHEFMHIYIYIYIRAFRSMTQLLGLKVAKGLVPSMKLLTDWT
jgi:hypothetical protein